MKLTAILLILFLSGCATTQKQEEKTITEKPSFKKAEVEFKTPQPQDEEKFKKEEVMMLFNDGLKQIEVNPRKAARLFKKVVNLIPERWEPYFNLGIIYMNLNDNDKAEQEFRRALKYKPPREIINNALGYIYLSKGNNWKAEKAFKKAAAHNKSPEAIINLANYYQLMENREKAIQYYRQAKKLAPSNTVLSYNRGIFLYKLGRYEEAMVEFDSAAKYFKGDIRLLFPMAMTYFKLGEYEDALKMFQEIITLSPDDPIPYENIGIIYEIYLGDMERALKSYTQYIEKGGDDVKAVKAWIEVVKFRLKQKREKNES